MTALLLSVIMVVSGVVGAWAFDERGQEQPTNEVASAITDFDFNGLYDADGIIINITEPEPFVVDQIPADYYELMEPMSEAFGVVRIIYDGNGHTSGLVPNEQSFDTPGSVTLSSGGNLARSGHILVGWKLFPSQSLEWLVPSHIDRDLGSPFSITVASVSGTFVASAIWMADTPSNATLTISPSHLVSWTAPAGVGNDTRIVTTNQPGGWTAESNQQIWLWVTTMPSANMLWITVLPNETGATRSGIVTVRAGNATPREILVTQPPQIQPVIPTVTLNNIPNITLGQSITVSGSSWQSTGTTWRMSAQVTGPGSIPNSGWLGETYSNSYNRTFTPTQIGTYTVTLYARSFPENDARTGQGRAQRTFNVTEPTLTLNPSSTTINDNNLTRTITAGGTATGNISINRGTLPSAVQITTSAVNNTITLTATRPAAGQPAVTGTHNVTVTRGGVSQNLAVSVNLNAVVPMVTVTFDADGGLVRNDSGNWVAGFERRVPAGTRTILPPLLPPTSLGGGYNDDITDAELDEMFRSISDRGIGDSETNFETNSIITTGWFGGLFNALLGQPEEEVFVHEDLWLRARWMQQGVRVTLYPTVPTGIISPFPSQQTFDLQHGESLGVGLPDLNSTTFRHAWDATPHSPVGWFTDGGSGSRVTGSTAFQQDTSVHIRWNVLTRHTTTWHHSPEIYFNIDMTNDPNQLPLTGLWFSGIIRARDIWNSTDTPIMVNFSSSSENSIKILDRPFHPEDNIALGTYEFITRDGSNATSSRIELYAPTIMLRIASLGLDNTGAGDLITGVIAHEIGHALGLLDGEDPRANPNTHGGFSDASLMNQNRDRARIHMPQPFDIISINWLYQQ